MGKAFPSAFTSTNITYAFKINEICPSNGNIKPDHEYSLPVQSILLLHLSIAPPSKMILIIEKIRPRILLEPICEKKE